MEALTKEQKYLLASNQGGALLNAGASWSALRNAGASLSDLLNAGASLSALRGDLNEDDIPLVKKPYSRMLAEIKAGERIHKQSTFGPENAPVVHTCGTPMCTGGHLVQMGGKKGWKLKERFGFAGAAALIHAKAHPGWPCQDFGSIPQDWAMAYIETMAKREAKEAA